MAKEPKKLEDLFHDTLKDIYFAEKKILATLPKMAKAAQNEELRAAFEKHEAETEDQVGRLEQIFAAIDQKPQGKTCAAIVGITDEGAEIMKEYKGSPALDAGLLAAAQAVEHYEISRYGTLIAWAEELGLEDAVPLLQDTLEEEKTADGTLTDIAKTAVNQQAEAASLQKPCSCGAFFPDPAGRANSKQARGWLPMAMLRLYGTGFSGEAALMVLGAVWPTLRGSFIKAFHGRCCARATRATRPPRRRAA